MNSGDVIAGKYRLNQPLGSGGMAEVWSATNTFTERQIAIKFMNSEVAKTPESATRFLKEAKVSARVNHPNVIDVHDVGQTEDGRLFLVMELLTGISLETALRKQSPPMTMHELALVMVEVAGALSAAHRSGIVHRDLKPTNIFLHKLREGIAMPKVLDFGVSKFLEDDQNHALTVAGTVLGSPLYMSPEQARGESALDGRTDIFAFGAILFEALTGSRAYEGPNFNALIVKIATSKPKDIDEHAPEAPESLRAVVRRCLEPDLNARAQSFDEIVVLLKAAMNELEFSEARLPASRVPVAAPDADATNALPLVRPGEHASGHTPGAIKAPQALTDTVPPAGSSPTSPSWHGATPNTSYASIHAPAASARGARTPWVVAGVAVVAASAMAALLFANGSGAGARVTASPTPPPAAPTAADGDRSTPTMSVNALPQAEANASKGQATSGPGRLDLTASPGACVVRIDGKERGTTPIVGLEIGAGTHNVTCTTRSGKTSSAVIRVDEGRTQSHAFATE